MLKHGCGRGSGREERRCGCPKVGEGNERANERDVVRIRTESGALTHCGDEPQSRGLEVLAAPVHGGERSGQLLDLLLCFAAVDVLVDGVVCHLCTSRCVPDGNVKVLLVQYLSLLL